MTNREVQIETNLEETLAQRIMQFFDIDLMASLYGLDNPLYPDKRYNINRDYLLTLVYGNCTCFGNSCIVVNGFASIDEYPVEFILNIKTNDIKIRILYIDEWIGLLDIYFSKTLDIIDDPMQLRCPRCGEVVDARYYPMSRGENDRAKYKLDRVKQLR